MPRTPVSKGMSIMTNNDHNTTLKRSVKNPTFGLKQPILDEFKLRQGNLSKWVPYEVGRSFRMLRSDWMWVECFWQRVSIYSQCSLRSDDTCVLGKLKTTITPAYLQFATCGSTYSWLFLSLSFYHTFYSHFGFFFFMIQLQESVKFKF